MKFVLKLFVCLVAVTAALLGLAYWDKITTPQYVEVYSDDDSEHYF